MTQCRDTNEKKNELEKTTKIYFIVILRAIVHKECIEKRLYKFSLGGATSLEEGKL